jgi:hypothetical protein
MFEALESRQFFSVAPGTEAVADMPAPTTVDTVVESRKPKPKPTSGSGQQTYMVVTMSDALITGY